MSVGTDFEIRSGIRSIALIKLYIDPGSDLEWSPREYLDSSDEKNIAP